MCIGVLRIQCTTAQCTAVQCTTAQCTADNNLIAIFFSLT